MVPHRPESSDLKLGAAYFLSASLTVSLTRFDGGVAFLWVATAILCAVLMHRPRRDWARAVLACSLASLIATGLFGFGWAMALPFVVINMTEALVASRLFRAFGYSRVPLGSMRWLWHFILSFGIAGPTSASVLAAILVGVTGGDPLTTLTNFFVGHALGNLTFIPVIALAVSGRLRAVLRAARQRSRAECGGLFVLVAGTIAATFAQSAQPLLFVPMLPMILVTFRLGEAGAAVSIGLLALIGGGLTLAGFGPMDLAAVGSRMQLFQFYLAATVMTLLPVAADLRTRARLHRDLRASEARYRLLADHSTDIILHLGPDGRILYASPSIHQLGGYAPPQVEGLNILKLVPEESRRRVLDGHLATIAARGQTHSYRHLAMLADGQQRWFESHCRVLLDEAGEVESVLSVVRDVSEQIAVEDQLAEAALTDSLTGLPNRRAFRARAVGIIASGVAANLAVIDIDHFKSVNDRFGHDAGDEILRSFAAIAQRVVRRNDLVARIGGEEFVLLLPDISRDEAVAICERLRAEVAASVHFTDAGPVKVTISGGLAVLGPPGLDAALKDADQALYRAKNKGRDQLALAA